MSVDRIPPSLLVAVLGAACSADAEPLPRIEILIDNSGVPHVYAATDEDVVYGAGYQMASDRLHHMEMTRRAALGRQAEVLGEPAAEDDELARLFDWPGWGRRHAEAMRMQNADTHALVQAWVDGVNRRIDEVEDGTAPLPWGFGPDEIDYAPERWTVEDVLAIATMTGFGNDLSFDREVFAAIAVQLAPDALAAVQMLAPARAVWTVGNGTMQSQAAPPTRTSAPPSVSVDDLSRTFATLRRFRRLRGIGSNNWVVGGEHTATGRPMLAGDPHLNFDAPGIFYAQHIDSKSRGGTIAAAGFSFVGTPGISVGQTDRAAWAPTTAFADVMDVWTVALPDPDHVRLGGNDVPIARRSEIIEVKNGTARTLELLDVPGFGVILPTDLVPIPLGEPDDRLLVGWTGFAPNPFEGLLGFNRADSVAAIEQAVDGFGGNFNFVGADEESITYRVGTRVPVRDLGDGRTPWLVQDGDDPASLWTDARLPAEQLPHGRGEGKGWIATANNDPFGFTANGRVDDDPWYFGAFFDPGWRAGRLDAELTRLAARGDVALEDMKALQTDVRSSLSDDVVPLVAAAWEAAATDPALATFRDRADIARLVELLTVQWDRLERRDSAAALAHHALCFFVTQRTIGDDLSLLFDQAIGLQPTFLIKIGTMALAGKYPDGDMVLQEGRHAIVLAAVGDVADLLTQRFGGVEPAAYRLGDVRATSFADATGRGLDRGTVPTDGGESTLDVVADAAFFDGQGGVLDQWSSTHGPIFRFVVEIGEDSTPRLDFAMPLGNVADPDSPHFEDLQADWLEGRYRTLPFARSDVEDALETRIVLDPELP